jgi:hypothetical protein
LQRGGRALSAVAGNKADLIGKIKSITPKGMTPITFSIRKVAERLKNVEQEATIVLVSDGGEKGRPLPPGQGSGVLRHQVRLAWDRLLYLSHKAETGTGSRRCCLRIWTISFDV